MDLHRLAFGWNLTLRSRAPDSVGRPQADRITTSTIEMSHARRSTMTTTNARLGSRNSTREDRLTRTRQRHGFEHDARADFGVGAPDER